MGVKKMKELEIYSNQKREQRVYVSSNLLRAIMSKSENNSSVYSRREAQGQ